MNKEQLFTVIRAGMVSLFILLIIIGSFMLSSLVYPFIYGFLLAFLINPFVNLLEKRMKLPRTIAVFSSLLILLSLFFGLITLFVAEIIISSNHLAVVLPLHIKTFIHYVENLFFSTLLPVYEQLSRSISSLETSHQETIMNYIQTFGSQVAAKMGLAVQQIFYGLSDFLISLPNLATALLFTVLATFFISKDWYKITSLIKKRLPAIIIQRTSHVLYDLKQAFFGYILGQFILIAITFFIVLIGLFILPVDYPFTISIIIAFIDLIPYLGTGLIFLPWILYSFFSHQLSLTIGLSILYGVVIVQRQLLEPKVLSSSIGVEPLAMLIALFVGFQLFGFAGLIIGPASLVFFNTLYKANIFRDIKAIIYPHKKS